MILYATTALLTQLTAAQDSETTSITTDALEYYLVQAFHARTANDRIALNHIGIEVQAADDGFLVTASLEGYPAHQAGIERGDKILQVDEKPFHPVFSFNAKDSEPSEFVPATAVFLLEFERRGEVTSIEINPVFENLYDSYRTATLNSVQEFSVGNKTIGYIRFWGLSRSTSDLFTLERTMRKFRDSDGLIIDLRNSYGFLSSRHLELFVRNGRGSFEVSDTANQHAAIAQDFSANAARTFTRPIVVLINSETRGGTELFAHGLAKPGRITTLGERTAGKIGSYTLSENTVRYAPADQTLIDGQRFESVGVVPDDPISFPFAQSRRSDPQFETTVDILLGRI
ncbi:MAG: PDZ domain-containing protein [Gammaproteobacteria bacterium]|nr:PDZ domain-containing protein [Gammaproteobacteria bacterium]